MGRHPFFISEEAGKREKERERQTERESTINISKNIQRKVNDL